MSFRLIAMLIWCAGSTLAQAGAITDWEALQRSLGGPIEHQAPPSIQELSLRMDALDAEVLFRKEPQDRSSFPVQLIEGERELSGRVEVKGSFTRNFLKKSLVVKLTDGARWHGWQRFALNAMATDPAQMREWLAWDLIDALGMPAPTVGYARLFINGRYIGLFLLFEWITDATFERQGLGGGGLLFHPDDSTFCGDLSLVNLPRLQTCWLNLSTPAVRGTGYAALKRLVEDLAVTPVADFDAYLESHFHVDSVLDWLVVNALTSNGDTYNKNYFLHRDATTGRWSVIPWDYDLGFGRNADPVLPFPQNILNDGFYYLNPPDLGVPHVLKDKTLRNPELMRRYRARTAHVLGIAQDPSASPSAYGWFSPQQWLSRLGRLERAITADLSRERYRNDPPDASQQHAEALRWYGLMRYHHLKKLLIEPSPFGTARWMAGADYPLLLDEFPQRVPLTLMQNLDLASGESWVVPTDDWLARPLGLLHFNGLTRPARVRLEVASNQVSDLLPPGFDTNDCARRSWFIDVKHPSGEIAVDLVFDYLQQNSIQHEWAEREEDRGLRLWQFRDGYWRELTSRFNPFTNTLSVEGVKIGGGQVSRFVACAMLQQQER